MTRHTSQLVVKPPSQVALQKGDQPGEYSITGGDGKTYGQRSKAVNLSQHLGHKITITGTLRAESAEKETEWLVTSVNEALTIEE